MKYNKNIQEKLDIRINDYKKYYNKIEIKIIPKYYELKDKNKFINIEGGNISYYHIYCNDDERNEIKRDYVTKDDNVTKIKIIIDEKIKSFTGLFKNYNVEKINFIKFNINDINNMSDIFRECSDLKELNLKYF